MTLSFYIHIIWNWNFILSTVCPFFGIALLICAVMIFSVIVWFWIGYALSDEDGKSEKMEKWKKQTKGLIIAFFVIISIGIILTLLPVMLGYDINFS
ncbi:hypothetical protein [Spiroplasma endosymbiont of Labia minor]|uniref:hypothetical protein n=1 Tax=Spiroplasma endosymbiont of Labia minor TaxID=3066305 RepID=UPI0030CE97E9